jgi:hypothetical protein
LWLVVTEDGGYGYELGDIELDIYMTQPFSPVPATATGGRRALSTVHATERRLYPCLILSADLRRRDLLLATLDEAGWAPVVCRDMDELALQGARVRAPMTIIDLVGLPQEARPTCQALCQRLHGVQSTLLTICGHEDDPAEEIWARQMGVWLYLPGLGDHEEVLQIATEARGIVERLAPQHRPAL